jgi:DNA (cytosine-5)-methyltransferase 1
VFVVGYLGDWRPAAAVLFERDSLRGNPAPSRKKGQETYQCLTTGSSQRYDAESETMIPVGVPDVMATLLSSTAGISRTGNAVTEHETYIPMANPIDTMNHIGRKDSHSMGDFQPGAPSYTLTKGHSHAVAHTYPEPIALAENTIGRKPENGGNGDGFTDGGPMYTLNATGVHGVAQAFSQTADCLTSAYGTKWNGNASATNGSLFAAHPIIGGVDYENNAHGPDDVTGPLLKGSPTGGGRPLPAIALQSMAVRRLTPVECERLQGFPDNYTDIKPKGKPTPDGPRYKALGNSWAVPVVNWIGKRIMMVEELL